MVEGECTYKDGDWLMLGLKQLVNSKQRSLEIRWVYTYNKFELCYAWIMEIKFQNQFQNYTDNFEMEVKGRGTCSYTGYEK